MEWLNVAGAVLGLAGLLGGISAAFYASRNKAQADATDRTISLQNQEITALTQALDREREQKRVLEAQVNELLGKVKALESTLTQAPAIAQLAENMVAQHNEVLGKLSEIASAMAGILQQEQLNGHTHDPKPKRVRRAAKSA